MRHKGFRSTVPMDDVLIAGCRLASKNKEIPTLCHSASLFYSDQCASYRYCTSRYHPDIQILASTGDTTVPFGSEANPMQFAPPLIATTCRPPTHIALSGRGRDREHAFCPELWLVRGKQETGYKFRKSHDWVEQLVDPDQRA